MTTEKIQAHGMGTDLVEPVWASLTTDVVSQLIENYEQFCRVEKIVWHSPRPFSSAAIVCIDGHNYFVKRHAADIRDVEGLLEEHAIINHLRENGVPVSHILKGKNGVSAFNIDDWTYEIHLLGEGVDLYRDAISWSPFMSSNHAFAAGEMLANVHRAARSFNGNKRKVQPLVSDFEIWMSDTPLKAVQQFMEGRKGLQQYLKKRTWQQDFKQVLWPFYEAFKPFKHSLKPLWTHNDWHASNLLWTDATENAKVQTVLDFGLGNLTNAIFDIATALERNVVEWLDINVPLKSVIHVEATKAFIRGYQSVTPLSESEKHALVTMLPIVHTDFALSEIDYFMCITNSEQDADAAYNDFLIGHANWFNSLQGKELLQAIQIELSI